MHMVRELDAGDVILQKIHTIGDQETGATLHDVLAELAPSALAEAIDLLHAGTAPRIPQDPTVVSYVGKLSREDGRIDWRLSAVEIERRIRAYHSWPGTYAVLENGARIKIFPPVFRDQSISCAPGMGVIHQQHWLVGCGDEALILSEVQAEGGKRMAAADFARGQRDGICFTLD
jgi:methionyl-tRNA formyltransferase